MSSRDIHFFLRDLMDIYKLDFKQSQECMYRFNLSVASYSQYHKYPKEYRAERILEIVKAWSVQFRYSELKKYNNLTERIISGMYWIDTEKEEEKRNKYFDALTKLCSNQEILIERLGVKNPCKMVTIPYILDKILG